MVNRLLPVEVCREPGGVTLLCVSRRDVPLVHLAVRCPGGEWLEPPPLPGLATLTADWLSEGPAGADLNSWRRRLEGRAIALRAGARDEYWTAGLGCLTEDLDEGLRALGELLARPAWPRGEWTRIVKQYRGQAREAWAQPANVVGKLSAVQNLGFRHPNAHPSFEQAFARARSAQAVALGRQAYFRGPGVYGLIGGDVGVEEGFRRLRELFAALPARVPPPLSEPPAAPSAARVWLMDHPKVDQAFFVLGRPGIRAADPQRLALRLANYALGGGGFSSRLMARVRAEMGHTYGIGSSAPEKRSSTPFTLQSFTKVDNLKAMLDLIRQVLGEVVAEGFTAEEVEAARDHLHGSLPLKLTSPEKMLAYAWAGLRTGLELEALEEDWTRCLATSREEVHVAARRLIGDAAFHLAVIGPAKDLRAQVEGWGAVATFPFRTTPNRWPA